MCYGTTNSSVCCSWSLRAHESTLCNKRSHCREKPTHRTWRLAPRESSSQQQDPVQPKINNFFKEIKKKFFNKKVKGRRGDGTLEEGGQAGGPGPSALSARGLGLSQPPPPTSCWKAAPWQWRCYLPTTRRTGRGVNWPDSGHVTRKAGPPLARGVVFSTPGSFRCRNLSLRKVGWHPSVRKQWPHWEQGGPYCQHLS